MCSTGNENSTTTTDQQNWFLFYFSHFMNPTHWLLSFLPEIDSKLVRVQSSSITTTHSIIRWSFHSANYHLHVWISKSIFNNNDRDSNKMHAVVFLYFTSYSMYFYIYIHYAFGSVLQAHTHTNNKHTYLRISEIISAKMIAYTQFPLGVLMSLSPQKFNVAQYFLTNS